MGKLSKLPEGTKLPVGSHDVKILKYLSEGGFAHIYKVEIEPVEEGSEIACLKRVIVPDKNGLNQLRKEVDVMKTLRHARNIVKYYDSHAERLPDGTYQVLVLMELCPNKSLLDYMNDRIKTKLTEPEILKIMLDISIGVSEMHKIKLIHRDIKIENVLIDAHNDFKLCDFGSTCSPLMPPKDQQEFQFLSHDILYQTTPQYRAPEMIDLYRRLPIDDKSDIWALGCFLYKLCYYTTPFEANGDIAILHASFQFLPAPVFSGDLKNLIIIMLQENPIFRPNIIQVIILVATMMKLDFKDLKIEDFYKAGPYNFHALHEYQRQKQQELIQQQQFYYQQQQQQLQQNQQLAQTSSQKSSSTNLVGNVPSADPSNPTYAYSSPVQQPAQAAAAPNLQPQTQEQSLAYQQQQSQFPIQEQSLVSPYKDKYPVSQPADQPSLNPELQDEKLELNEKHNAEDSDDLEGLEENLDNVEERYPSLEDLLDTPQRPRDDTTISNKSKLSSESPPASSSPAPSIKPPSYPVKPIILSSPEIKKLNPEELQQYNYQHQVYQSQFQYYQQVQQQQQQQQQQHNQQKFQKSQENPAGLQSPVPQYSSKSSKSSRISGEGSKTPTAFESKEAWEKSHSKIDKSAERLADDIFAGGTKSPATKPQKTNQSVKSDHSVVSAKTDISYSSDEDRMKLSKSESSNKETQKYPDIENKEQEVEETLEYTPTEVAQHSKEELTEENLSKAQPSQLKEEVSQKADNEMNNFPNSVSRPMPIPNQSQYISAPMIPTMNSNSYTSSSNPFPMTSKAPTNQQQSQQQHQLTQDTTQGPKLPERKNANPWSDFTNNSKSSPMTKVSSHPGTMNAVPTLNSQNKFNHLNANNIHDQFNNMSIYDGQRPKKFDTPTLPNNQAEPNLIDLEVGLDSSSSASGTPGATPLALPKQRDANNRLESEPSLLDLKDLDDKQAKAPEKPQFKKRISSIQNASNFSFQEEVIDFASDDENPENSSKMNRISIRNSLKKPKGRKSGEHKRTDSSNGEGSKKRISFFGGSSSNNS